MGRKYPWPGRPSWKAPITKEGFCANGPERTSTQHSEPGIYRTNHGAACAGAASAGAPLVCFKVQDRLRLPFARMKIPTQAPSKKLTPAAPDNIIIRQIPHNNPYIK
ncbi:hypothetical protein TRIP_B350016 [uncultured Desulfatiglans sp.]|uniref:Uncharacterized protein n=1 Tax=Uncultured Desulfatiglans sp. TaxID=1748965 RepID=A0A653AA26_UNCDX|nr:hypothetical protein TRIP_B350016 [uncultured Desulfatiglans sp.]